MTDDGYVFDLRLRPPTPALDRVTSYLEVRYADVLMRRDAARSLRRHMAAAAVSAVPGEAAETPPAALFAAASLSAAERSAVTSALDELLGSGQYKQYRDAVLQLYCDGLVSWGELQACWGAAQAGEELAAAERGPPSELTGVLFAAAFAAAVQRVGHVCIGEGLVGGMMCVCMCVCTVRLATSGCMPLCGLTMPGKHGKGWSHITKLSCRLHDTYDTKRGMIQSLLLIAVMLSPLPSSPPPCLTV